MPEKVLLYDAKTKPLRGLNTALDPYTLPEGIASLLTNYRIGNGVLECRGGMTATLGTVNASKIARGKWTGNIGGASYMAEAVYDGAGKTLVYVSSAPATWTQITDDAGDWGDTRLTGNAPVTFAAVPDPFGIADRLLFADGTGSVRAWFNSTTYHAGLVAPITAPMADVAAPEVGDMMVRVNAIAASGTNATGAGTYTGDVDGLDFADSGASPNIVRRLTIETTVANLDDAGLDCSHSVTLSAPIADRQFLLLVNTSYTLLWDKLQVKWGSDILWDPTAPASYSRPIPVPVDGTARTLWIFKLPTQTASISSATTYNLHFTWVAATNEAPSANVTADIEFIGITHGSPVYSDLAIGVTSMNTTTGVESPGVIYSNYVADRFSDWGGPIMNGLRLPRSPLIKCIYRCKFKNVSTAELALGVDAAVFYYRAPGQKRFKVLRTPQILTTITTGTWAVASGSVNSVLELTAPSAAFYSLPDVYMPDAYNMAPPATKALLWANERLYVGGATYQNANVRISERKNAFRIRRFTERERGIIASDDPVTLSAGTVIVQAFIALASSLLGSDGVAVFTDGSVLLTGGTDSNQMQRMTRISTFGTVSPLSIASLNNIVYYLDTEMQVREFSGGQPQSITRSWVDDQLAGIPADYRKYADAAVWDDKYYLFFTPSGATTNTKGLVWNANELNERQWVNDTPVLAIQSLISWFDGTNQKKRLIAITASGTAVEYDLSTQTTDQGANITCTVTLPEIVAPDGKILTVNQIGVIADQVTGSTSNTLTRTYKPAGGAATSNLNLANASNNQINLYDGAQTGASNGTSVQVKLVLGLTAGKKVYRIDAEIEERNHGFGKST